MDLRSIDQTHWFHWGSHYFNGLIDNSEIKENGRQKAVDIGHLAHSCLNQAKHKHQERVIDIRFMKIIDSKIDNYKYANHVRNNKMKRISNRTVSDKAMQTKNGVIPMKSI
ncbi:12089_t:CDS:2, partial [Gigaspora margarita]